MAMMAAAASWAMRSAAVSRSVRLGAMLDILGVDKNPRVPSLTRAVRGSTAQARIAALPCPDIPGWRVLVPDIRLRIELLDTDPLVWRRVVVPEQINLHRFHPESAGYPHRTRCEGECGVSRLQASLPLLVCGYIQSWSGLDEAPARFEVSP
ncbi:IS1096 element passenger TnpR family protein [Halomonas mongoliensis]|uniref:IS1096 element passenger TnpR family protein n=1 Tax=Halomonas mongoliensis TaxID=321265 RepID=UPI00403AF396